MPRGLTDEPPPAEPSDGRPVAAAPSASRRVLGVDVGVLFLGLGALSALKGLNLIVTPTSSYLYYTDYRFGFVPRGLVGQLFSPVLAAVPPSAHDGLLMAWHYAAVAALLVALSRLAAGTVAAAGGRAGVLAMAVLLFCSPLIPSLAYFTAAPDVLLCLLTLGVVAATRARRFALAWALFLIGALVHQLMVFIALPVMVLGSLAHARRRVPAVAGSVAVGLAACVVVLMAPAPDERLLERFIEHGMQAEAAREMYEIQLGQKSAEMLGVMAGLWRDDLANGLIATAFGACAGAAILVACLLAPGVLRPGVAPPLLPFVPPGGPRAALTSLLVLGVGLSPLLVLAFAWDLSRLANLSTFTAFLVADMLLRRAPPVRTPPPPRSRLAAAACGALAAVFLCLPFVGLWFKGTHLNTQGPLVPNPILQLDATRAAVVGLLRLYEGNAR